MSRGSMAEGRITAFPHWICGAFPGESVSIIAEQALGSYKPASHRALPHVMVTSDLCLQFPHLQNGMMIIGIMM